MSSILAGKFTVSSKNLVNNFTTLNPNITFKRNGGYRVNTVVLPSFYNINSNTNTFTIRNSVNTVFNIVLPNGYYTADDLLTALKNALNGGGTGNTGWDVVSSPLSLNSGVSGIYKITVSSNQNFSIDATSNMCPLLGYSTFKSGSNSYVADDMINVSGYNSLYLCSSTLAGFNTDQNVFSFGSGDVIWNIPIQANFGSNTYYETTHFEFIPIGNEQDIILNRVDFFFRDENGNVIDFDSSSSNFIVEIAFF